MIDTLPWSSCSCQSPWLPCFGHTISSTGPSVSPFRDFFLIKPLFLIIIQKLFFQLAKKAAEKAEKEKDASPNPSDSDKVKQKQCVVVLGYFDNENTCLSGCLISSKRPSLHHLDFASSASCMRRQDFAFIC